MGTSEKLFLSAVVMGLTPSTPVELEQRKELEKQIGRELTREELSGLESLFTTEKSVDDNLENIKASRSWAEMSRGLSPVRAPVAQSSVTAPKSSPATEKPKEDLSLLVKSYEPLLNSRQRDERRAALGLLESAIVRCTRVNQADLTAWATTQVATTQFLRDQRKVTPPPTKGREKKGRDKTRLAKKTSPEEEALRRKYGPSWASDDGYKAEVRKLRAQRREQKA